MHDDNRMFVRQPATVPAIPLKTLSLPALLAAALAFSLPVFSTAAKAEAGVNLSGSAAQEEYALPLSLTKTIDWRRVTISPWWQNASWRLSADLPLVSRDAEVRGPAGALIAGESDSGLGDARLNAKRSWQLSDDSADLAAFAYVGSSVKLPTGDENAGTLVPGAIIRPTRQGEYSLGTGSTDFSISPGVNAANKWIWATAEAGYIISNGGAVPQDDRPTVYLGLGLTPASFLELSVEFDYEGEVSTGSGTLEQMTYTLTVIPVEKLSLSLSTYTDNSAKTPDSNWSLGVSSGF